MTLSDLSIRRPVVAWMLMASLIIFGAICLGRLGVSQMPDVDFPVLTVNLTWDGAAPEVLETAVVDPIEEAVIATQGLRDMSSNIQLGKAAITLQFDVDRNVDAALTEVQSKISTVRLPVGASLPTIDKTNPEDEPIILITVSGKRSLHDLTEYIEKILADKFRVVPGVGEVVLGGYNRRNLRIWVDNDKLKSLQLTIADLKTALQQDHLEEASGYLENSKNQINIRTMGEGITPEQVGDIQIKSRGGESIYNSWIRIKDVARVEDGLDDIQHLGFMQGGSSIALGIKKQRGVNAVSVAKAVKAKLQELRTTLPKDIQLDINFDSTIFIEESIQDTLFTLVLSALITGVVCYFFLGSWSSTFNVLFSIPTSVLGTFIVMYFMGFTLNFFTLLGLSLAIGIIVDDSIMVLENIVRHAEMGKDKVLASSDGAREITFAAMVTTAAVMAIFLPVVFMKGIVGKYFFQFGVTISASVLLSLLEAITITPMRCSEFLTVGNEETKGFAAKWWDRVFSQWEGWYKRLLRWSLDHRGIVVGVSFVIFLVSLLIGYFLRMEFLPPQDESAFLVHIETPVGSSLSFTSEKVIESEKVIQNHPEVSKLFAAIGGFSYTTGAANGDISEGVVNAATVYVTLKPSGDRQLSQQALIEILRRELNAIPDLKAYPQDLSSRGFTAGKGYPIELNIRGDDYKGLEKIANNISARLEKTGLITDIHMDLRNGMPEMHLIPNRDEAARSGISIQTIADTVSYAIGGLIQGEFTNGDRRYDVRLRLEDKQRSQQQDIEQLQVRTSGNELIPITAVARIEEVKTYQNLTRRLRERSITIFGNVALGKSQSDALAKAEKIANEEISPGYRLFLGGGALAFRETFESLLFTLWLGVLIAYMVLGAQFNSFVHPFTVLIALPFSVSGAFMALLLTNQSLNLYSMIGLILLMGIAKKNSILLVEFANQSREHKGVNSHEAMLIAGPVRLRPILMTSFATLAASIPPALAIGPGAESRVPLAVTVLGGVALSTFFTLLVVPCAYVMLSRLEHPFTRKDAPSPLKKTEPRVQEGH
ncbi:MAG: efflux RND transporter permease subunit [Verrucomicrobiota bacterium]